MNSYWITFTHKIIHKERILLVATSQQYHTDHIITVTNYCKQVSSTVEISLSDIHSVLCILYMFCIQSWC